MYTISIDILIKNITQTRKNFYLCMYVFENQVGLKYIKIPVTAIYLSMRNLYDYRLS